MDIVVELFNQNCILVRLCTFPTVSENVFRAFFVAFVVFLSVVHLIFVGFLRRFRAISSSPGNMGWNIVKRNAGSLNDDVGLISYLISCSRVTNWAFSLDNLKLRYNIYIFKHFDFKFLSKLDLSQLIIFPHDCLF